MPILATLRANIAATLLGLLAAVLLAISVYQHVQIHGFLWIDGLQDKVETLQRDNNELRAELKSISDKRNEQAETTRGNIKKAEEGERKARDIADEIRGAPIPPNCETPGIEILRNEI